MAKAARKATSKTRRRRQRPKSAASTAAAEHPTQRLVQRETFDRGREVPGDSPAEWEARRFIRRVMERNPTGLRGRRKADFARVVCKRFKISGRSFERIW